MFIGICNTLWDIIKDNYREPLDSLHKDIDDMRIFIHTGENKLGTEMETMERKYAPECAKTNYKTFTFLMRSWNSSKNQ